MTSRHCPICTPSIPAFTTDYRFFQHLIRHLKDNMVETKMANALLKYTNIRETLSSKTLSRYPWNPFAESILDDPTFGQNLISRLWDAYKKDPFSFINILKHVENSDNHKVINEIRISFPIARSNGNKKRDAPSSVPIRSVKKNKSVSEVPSPGTTGGLEALTAAAIHRRQQQRQKQERQKLVNILASMIPPSKKSELQAARKLSHLREN